jgi:hypothetical protein
LYVTGGGGRLLVAHGDDGRALLNGLGQLRSPVERRLDVAVLAGGLDSFPTHVVTVERLRPRAVLAFGGVGPELAERLDWPVLTSGLKMALGAQLSVELVAGPDLIREPAWWAVVVASPASRMLLAPTEEGASLVPSSTPWEVVAGPAEAFASGGAIDGRLIVSSYGSDPTLPSAEWLLPVGRGAAVRMRFLERGIEAPDNAIPVVRDGAKTGEETGRRYVKSPHIYGTMKA